MNIKERIVAAGAVGMVLLVVGVLIAFFYALWWLWAIFT